MLVVASDTCPIQARIVLMSMPARSKCVAVVWRIVCGLNCFLLSKVAIGRLPLRRVLPAHEFRIASAVVGGGCEKHGLTGLTTERCRDKSQAAELTAIDRALSLSEMPGK
jgi:hypothetical protein